MKRKLPLTLSEHSFPSSERGVSSERDVRALPVVMAILLLVSCSSWAWSQADEPQTDPTPVEQDLPQDADLFDEASEEELDAIDDESEFRGTNRSDLDLIEGLLEESQDSVDTGFVYDPAGRRDPFRSLLRVPDTVERNVGPRPDGIPGLLIDNITVTGIWMWPDGPVAQVRSAEDPISFLLRPGVRVFDGEVISVTWSKEEGGKVVFRQAVRDPNSPKPFKEVVRRIQL